MVKAVYRDGKWFAMEGNKVFAVLGKVNKSEAETMVEIINESLR